MYTKPGVISYGLRSEMWFALGAIEMLYRLKGPGEPTITSGLDGTHSPKSLHYTGYAVDIRTRNLSKQQAQEIYDLLRRHLDPLGFDTVLEPDHIHVEFDAKKGESIFQEGV